MRRTLILATALVLASGVAFSGDYHTGNSLICSDCHVMHAQTSHEYGPGTTATTYAPTTYLLKGPVNEMCLACHDQNGAADVLGADIQNLSNRSAGALNRAGQTIDGTYSDYMGHSLGSADMAPGGTFQAAAGLTCVDCHHQHGYAGFGTTDGAGNTVTNAYRNLAAIGGKSVSYAALTNDLTKDVFESYPTAYETIDVNLNEPNTAASGTADWCAGCHGEFHGAVPGPEVGGVLVGTHYEEFIRHPSSTVNIGDIGGGHSNLGDFVAHASRVRVMSPTGDWGPIAAAWNETDAAGVTPTCLSCHKAHGNARPFGLIYADGSGDAAAGPGEDGRGSGARDLCQQCHVQGG